MIPIAQHQKPLLHFKRLGRTDEFNCLPFGLSSPWVFIKPARLIVATLQTMGLRVIIYIDDILIRPVARILRRGVIKDRTRGFFCWPCPLYDI